MSSGVHQFFLPDLKRQKNLSLWALISENSIMALRTASDVFLPEESYLGHPTEDMETPDGGKPIRTNERVC